VAVLTKVLQEKSRQVEALAATVERLERQVSQMTRNARQ
jgi:hypothetical protein